MLETLPSQGFSFLVGSMTLKKASIAYIQQNLKA
jgi:hypothetical protein